MVREYETYERMSLAAFLNILKRLKAQEVRESEAQVVLETSVEAVRLLSVHAAKGLEFPVVFLAGVEDGIIPHKRSLLENEEGDYEANMEEERRLFYVAITRAQTKLFITACRTRTVLRQSIQSGLSPFIEEIPKHLIEFKEPQHEIPDDALGQDLFAKMKQKWAAKADEAGSV